MVGGALICALDYIFGGFSYKLRYSENYFIRWLSRLNISRNLCLYHLRLFRRLLQGLFAQGKIRQYLSDQVSTTVS
jgi:abortive infection bacteriophage resistance protein